MKYFLGLGSNIKNKREHIVSAIEFLNKSGDVTKKSQLYETSPVGMLPEFTESFLNCAVEFKTDITPHNLLKKIKKYESSCGRDITNSHMQPRNIDIDILFCDNRVISSEQLTIPHPEVCNRKFVLIPLRDIAPAYMHPGENKSIIQILEDTESDETIIQVTENY